MSATEHENLEIVAQNMNNADPDNIERIVWKQIAKRTLGEIEANDLFEDVVRDLAKDLQKTNAKDADADTSGITTFEDYVAKQSSEKIQPDTEGAPTDYGEYLEANDGRQLREIDGDLYLDGDADE